MLTNFVFIWVDQSLLLQFPVPVVPVLMVELRHLGLLLVLPLLALVGQLALRELLLDEFQVSNKAPVLLGEKPAVKYIITLFLDFLLHCLLRLYVCCLMM